MFDNIRAQYEDIVYTVFRVVVGLFFALHGLQKFGVLSGGFALPGSPTMIVAAIIETVGGILILIGLWTTIAAFISSGLMASAYWMAHAFGGAGPWFNPLANKGELAAVYCFVFLYIAFAGSSKYSVDAKCCKTPVAKK